MVHSRCFFKTCWWLFTLTLLLPNCRAAEPKNADGIHWFAGSVEQAFAHAKEQGKPVFLYWGASWCPPCNELKATVFRSPEFIDKTRFFVAVYLDGDTEMAQRRGESFGVMGYPTLILFDKNGREVTRIPGGMDLQRYPEVLDLVLQDSQPASELVTRIEAQGYQPTPAELSLLAYYAWQQDAGKTLGGHDALVLLRKLGDLAPPGAAELRGRFNAEYLYRLSKSTTELAEPARTDAVQRLQQLLGDPRQSRSSLYFVIYDCRAVIEALTANDDTTSDRLAAAWGTSLERLSRETGLSVAERLNLYKGRLELLALQGKEAPVALQQQIAADISRARSAARGPFEKVTVSYSGYTLLQDSGQSAAAQRLLESELTEENNASYWMLILAGMSKKAERNQEAIEWYRAAWKASTGGATRLQWGTYYLDNLTKLQPDDLETIESVARQILGELGRQQQVLYGRNTRAVQRIGKSLLDWADRPARQQVYQHLQLAFQDLCATQFSETEQQQACNALFSGEGAS